MKAMKKKIHLFIVLITGLILVSGCATVYKSNEWDVSFTKQNKVVIMPFEITADALDMKTYNTTIAEFRELAVDESLFLQAYMYMKALKQTKRNKYNFTFADPREINQSILDAGFAYTDIKNMQVKKIAEVTKADVVIIGKIFRTELGKETKKDHVDMQITFYDKNGEILWKYLNSKKASFGKSSFFNDKILAKRALKRNPYRRDIALRIYNLFNGDSNQKHIK